MIETGSTEVRAGLVIRYQLAGSETGEVNGWGMAAMPHPSSALRPCSSKAGWSGLNCSGFRLRFEAGAEKIDVQFMETTQDAPAEMLIKLWPWLEANRNKLIMAAVAIILVVGVYNFISSQQAAKEQSAGAALTELLMTPPAGTDPVVALNNLAVQYAGTAAAQRAQLQAGASLFTEGKYTEAEALFQKFLDTNPGSVLAATAQLGLGASLEAEGKLDPASTSYEKVASTFSGSPSALPALCGLGRIAEAQGRLKEALDRYESAARFGNTGGSMAQEASIRAAELRPKVAAMTPAPAASAVVPVFTPPATAVPATK
jgi:TolA-binding protein